MRIARAFRRRHQALSELTVAQLRRIADREDIPNYKKLRRDDLLATLAALPVDVHPPATNPPEASNDA